MNNQKLSIPAQNERCACPQQLVAKRAALLFDRIYNPWLSHDDSIPSSLMFDIPNSRELFNTAWEKSLKALFKKEKISKHMPKNRTTADETLNVINEFQLRVRVESFRLAGYTVTPVYNSQQRFFWTTHPATTLFIKPL